MFTLVADIMKKILLIILALFICSFTVMAEKVTPPFTIAVGDDSPASDVMLSSTIIPSLEAKGYANFSVGIVKLFSEINALSLDNQVLLAIYNSKGKIIIGQNSQTYHVTFTTDLTQILDNKGIDSETIFSNDLDSSDLNDLFEKSEKETPPFRIAVADNAPASDVMLSTDIISSLKAQGYADIPVGAAQLFSDIDALSLDNQVVLAINNGVAIIIIGATSPTDHVKFGVDIANILEDKKIEYKTITSNDLESSDLMDAFEDFIPEEPDEPTNEMDLKIISVSFEPGDFLLNSYEKPIALIRNNGDNDITSPFYINYNDGLKNFGGAKITIIKAGETKTVYVNIISIHEKLKEIEFTIAVGDKVYDKLTKQVVINTANCIDSDKSRPNNPGDSSHFIKGTTISGQDIFYDVCTNFPQTGSLKEYECSGGQLIANEYNCELGCNDGACKIDHECDSNFNCDDKNACTFDFCQGTPKRKCEYTKKDGCEHNGNCIPLGTRIENQYCSLNNKLTNFKEDKESCQNDYECKSNNCFNSVCKPLCEGCLTKDNTCTPYGTRIDNKYCDLSGLFHLQKDKSESCNNVYECISGVCVDNKCISQNLIQKIISWFQKLFGE